ncbi:hypothetical protein IE4872_CH01757 [Rhizobium gallicum]|uniref:Uncharacterized protein n=1 Tax=Rhizobium gallicum TaxID=56730 RepID=A0A1L5NHP6_9HYPH|nr:hypothetical protein IE4872_CH01757 [Rhizobium gallicum]
MFLVVRFILPISDFILEDLNVLANNAAEAAEKIGQFKITIFRSLCRLAPRPFRRKIEKCAVFPSAL